MDMLLFHGWNSIIELIKMGDTTKVRHSLKFIELPMIKGFGSNCCFEVLHIITYSKKVIMF